MRFFLLAQILALVNAFLTSSGILPPRRPLSNHPGSRQSSLVTISSQNESGPPENNTCALSESVDPSVATNTTPDVKKRLQFAPFSFLKKAEHKTSPSHHDGHNGNPAVHQLEHRGKEKISLKLSEKVVSGVEKRIPETQATKIAEKTSSRLERIGEKVVEKAAKTSSNKAMERTGERFFARAAGTGERAAEKAALSAAERTGERLAARAAETGERAAERAALSASERTGGRFVVRAAEAGERSAERATARAAERAGERFVARAAETGERSAERAALSAAERTGKRYVARAAEAGERSAERAALSAAERTGEKFAARAAETGERVAERAALSSAERTGAIWLRLGRGLTITIPVLGGLFALYLLKSDIQRLREERQQQIKTSSAFFLGAGVVDGLDSMSHFFIAYALWAHVSHRVLVIAEQISFGCAIASTLCAVIGEIISLQIQKRRKRMELIDLDSSDNDTPIIPRSPAQA